MSPAEALRLIQGFAAAGRVRFSAHAEQRMEARNVTRLDVRAAIRSAEAAAPQRDSGTWRLDGIDTDGDPLAVVCALRDGAVVVTVF